MEGAQVSPRARLSSPPSRPRNRLPPGSSGRPGPATSLRASASTASHLLQRPSRSARDPLLAVMKRPISRFYL